MIRLLPFSLTLSAVLFTLAKELPNWNVASGVNTLLYAAIWLGPVLLTPYVTLRSMDEDELAKYVGRDVRRRPKETLFHLVCRLHLLHNSVIRLLNSSTVAGRAGKSWAKQLRANKEKLRFITSGDYSIQLAEELYSHFDFHSHRILLEYLRFSPYRLQRIINAYLESVRRHAAARDFYNVFRENPNQTRQAFNVIEEEYRERAKTELNAAGKEWRACFERIARWRSGLDLLDSPEIIWQGLEIVRIPSTGGAILKLLQELRRLCEDKQYLLAKNLLNLVDHARGSSFKALADLEPWYVEVVASLEDPKIEASLPPDLKKGWDQAMVGLRERFLELVKKNYKSPKNLMIATSGFSRAVLNCLDAMSSVMGYSPQVFVFETETVLRNDHREMVEALKEKGIKASLVKLHVGSRRLFRDHIDLSVFGVEAMDYKCNILHPRGHSDILDTLAEPPRSKRHHIVAVGESWKVKQFSLDRLDPDLIVVYRGGCFDYIITDHQVHAVRKNPNLECCAVEWQKIRQPLTTHRPPGNRDSESSRGRG